MESIRPIEVRDLYDLMTLEGEAFGGDRWDLEDYATYARDGYEGLVFVDAGKESTDKRMRGTVWYGVGEGGAIEIATIAVFSEYRGRGYGRQLLRRAMFLCDLAGSRNFYLDVRIDNEAAIKLYESEGFVKLHQIPDYYNNGSPAWRMECRR